MSAVTGYSVERCEGAACANFVEVGTPPGTAFSDTGLAEATTYRYRVRAVDAAGNLSGYSAIQNAATTDTQPPTEPTGLSATAVSGTQINLAWTGSSDNVAVASYRVERCQGAGCTVFVQVATPTGTSFSDTGLRPRRRYRYRVRAADAAGNLSGYTAIQNATTRGHAGADGADRPGGDRRLPEPDRPRLDGVDRQRRASRATGSSAARERRVRTSSQVATPTAASFSDTGLAAATTYRYRVRAEDTAGNLGGYSSDRERDDAGHAGADRPDGPFGDGGVGEPDQSWLGGVDRQRRGRELPGRALSGCGLFGLRPGRDAERSDVQRHGAGGGDELQLPGAGGGCGRQPERLLERGERDHAGGRTLFALLGRLADGDRARRGLDGGRRHLLERDGYPHGRQHRRP